MRDIRDDLKQRVTLLQTERDELQRQLQEKLAELDEYEKQLSALLAVEERRALKNSENATPSPIPLPWLQSESVGDWVVEARPKDFERSILEIMSNSENWTHADIKEQIEKKGWRLKNGSLGRAIQGQLLSMKQRGLVDFVGDKRWRRKAASTAML